MGVTGAKQVSLSWPAECFSVLSSWAPTLWVQRVCLSVPVPQPSPKEPWKEQSPYQDAHR